MTVLIISPAFPPISSVGVVRMSSLSAYLHSKNDDVTVVCDSPNSNNSNGNHIHTPDGINIIRVNCPCQKNGVRIKLYRSAIESALSKKKYDIILVTVGPYFPLHFVPWLSRKYKIPVVIDFRDVGALDTFSTTGFLQTLKVLMARSYEFYYEFRAVSASDAVVSVTDGWMKKKQRNYPFFSNKMFCIQNGFDGERLKSIAISETTEPHTVAIMGKLAYYSTKHAQMLISAIKDLSEKYNDIRLLHISDKESDVEQMINDIDLSESHYNLTGFIDYVEGIKMLSLAAAYVIVDSRKDAMGTKIYDYLYLNKPVIYIGVPNTCLSRFIQGFENGYVCDTKEKIIETLKLLFDHHIDFLDHCYTKNSYSRENSNREYRSLLLGVIEKKQHR